MSSVLEITQLPTGEIVLRREDGEGEPLATIQFSAETIEFLGDSTLEVGKAMIGAGMQMVGEMHELYEVDENGNTQSSRVVH